VETTGLRSERTKMMTQDRVAVWLGIDWADQKHQWAMRINGRDARPTRRIGTYTGGG
jgi:hypothetical protein